MSGHHLAKKYLVLGLDARHVEKIVDTLVHIQLFCERCGVFVLGHIPALEPAGEVHRHEPTRHMTGQSERAPDSPEDHLAHPLWFCAEILKPSPYSITMMPFFRLDLFDLFAFR